MTDKPASPIRPTDDEARALARALIDTARFAALAVLEPGSGLPAVTRVALATDEDGLPVSLISELSAHTRALMADPRCALLLGEPGGRGDPLTHPRLSLSCEADFVARDAPRRAALRSRYLRLRPKARLYADFADFHLVRFRPLRAALNGGFGRAWDMTADDLRPRGGQPGRF
ncbi:MAG: HugZ family protein [Rhodobacteraceae bacterium]|nr:HugZ family protein [Paracoccaceae bacterium]